MSELATNTPAAKITTGKWSRPFRLAVSPAVGWVEVSLGPGPIPALLAQTSLFGLGKLIAWQPMSDIATTITNPAPGVATVGTLLIELFWLTAFVLVANLFIAAIVYAVTFLLGQKQRFGMLLTWVAYSLLPLGLGYLAGTIPLWFIQPLSTDIMTVLSWQIKPFALGLVPFIPTYFTPLSIQWFVASLFDAFGIWSLVLFVSGAKYFLKQDLRNILWITLGLVLIFFLAAIGAWQVFQAMLVRLG